VSKAGKIFFYILSWAPLVWTILILVAALLHSFIDSSGSYSFKHALVNIFGWAFFFYVFYGGFLIWFALTILLTWKKIITKRQSIINIFLAVAGILAAYLTLHYDIFGVIGCGLD
jgi:hypothetical protein